jgi:FkbM family methyltransferase
LFEGAYYIYKRFLEAGDIRVLGRFVEPGALVIDVGANIGFFTRFFGRCVSQGGKVIAIEPESSNFQRLNQMLFRTGFRTVVEPIQAVAASQSGVLRLRINPLHPADHKIAQEGVPVDSVSLDELVAERHWPMVSLIKIDVQGAEGMVLQGARQTIERFHPALFLELDDDNLRAMQADAEAIIGLLRAYGYAFYRIIKGKISSPLEMRDCLKLCSAGRYADFLCLHSDSTNSGLWNRSAPCPGQPMAQ